MKAVLAPNGRPARLEVRARYEAAIPSRKRGYVFESLDDTANWDLREKSYTLDELARISIYLYKNDPIIKGLIDRFVIDTVGCGIMGIPASSSKEWNKRTKAFEQRDLRYPVLNRRWARGLTQRIILRHVLLEGSIFQILVDEPEVSTQLIRQHRLKSIQRDRFGRPTSYTFRVMRRGEERTVTYPASAVVHWQNSIFADAPMGEPLMAAALNTARDMAEIISFEKDAVKDASSRTDIIETPSGTAPTPSTILSETFIDENGEQSTRYYEDTWRSKPLVLRSGDKYTPYVPQRPSPAWQGFMDWLASAVCLSIGYPPAVALGNKIGGVDSRRDLATAQRTIEPLQEDFTDGWRRVRRHLLTPHVEEGGALSPAPDDWEEVRWQFPKPKTADYGREAQQDREDVREGLMTREEYWARQYQDPDEQDQRVIEEAVARKEAIEAAGLTVDEFRSLVDLHSTATARAEQPKPFQQER